MDPVERITNARTLLDSIDPDTITDQNTVVLHALVAIGELLAAHQPKETP